MSANDFAQRPRGPPALVTGGLNPRAAQDNRNGISTTTGIVSSAGASRSAGPPMTRAEKFEDEKKRIVESCFGKREADGSISESYITHIRILEDAAHPSSPPPAGSPPENKKPRVIIVAVRKSGRVRMHKARENANGSFSIGKTWVLDDLSAIHSFTNATPSNSEEQQNKERAGGTGFIVTIQKPYYWQAITNKEKDFFIFSLIKIYRKYTGGKLLQLHGFDPQELEQMTGAGPQAGAQPKTPQTPSGRGGNGALNQGSSTSHGARQPVPQRNERPREPGGDTRRRKSPERSSRERTPQARPQQEPPPQVRPSQERVLRTTDSNDRIPYVPGQFPTSEFVRNLNPNTSQQHLKDIRSDSPSRSDNSTQSSVRQETRLRTQIGTHSTESFRSRKEYESSGEAAAKRPSVERTRQNGSYNTSSSFDSSNGLQAISLNNTNLPLALRSGSSETRQPSQVSRERRPSIAGSKPGSSQKSSESRADNDGDASVAAVEPPGSDVRERLISDNRNNQDKLLSNNHHHHLTQRSNTLGVSPSVDVNESDNSAAPTTLHQKPPASANMESAAIDKQASPQSVSDVSKESPPEVESHRPGLGPMFKRRSNKELASTFRKTANAYNSFKPRAGGAAEKLRNENEKSPSENDGVTGVFPAPSILKQTSRDSGESPKVDPPADNLPPSVLEVKGDTPPTKPVVSVDSPTTQQESETSDVPSTPKNAPEERRKKRRSDNSSEYARVLGINHGLLEGRTFEIETVLNDFGWGKESKESNAFEELQLGLWKELNRVEAGSWLGTLENNDERVNAVGSMMDRVIAECEELDCLLTLYNAELGTLSEDVAYIEAQSQGLQVQTANQKLLHTELKNLLNTISISAADLQVLKDASLTKSQGLRAVENTLSQLYTAMLTIDPKLRQNGTRPNTSDQASVDRSSMSGLAGGELSSMRAVRDKKDGYRSESVEFIYRLRHSMLIKFREVEAQTTILLEQRRNDTKSRNLTKLDHRIREKPRRDLWLYSPLMLFTREMEPSEWENFMRMYESSARKPYQDEYKDNVSAWKGITRASLGEEDTLFTTPEKETESLVGRKLTVKRSKTVRVDGSSRISTGSKPQDGKVSAYEAFAGALNEMARMMMVEQNFVVNLFHITSLETTDFLDAVAIAPEARRGGDPTERKIPDPDRNMAKRVESIMEEIYPSWPTELQNLIDWVVKQDALQGIGVLFSLELQLSEIEDTNQEFLSHSLTKVHDRLAALFGRFVDEQIRSIEDTKVKLKKRKGVISFMKIFPNFTFAVESMLPPLPDAPHPPVRTLVDDAYQKINQAMFESLKHIAKESPQSNTTTVVGAAARGDLEDKEALNYHILLIENMNHYVEEVAPRDNPVLEAWKARAAGDMEQHMQLYVSAVVRRPLGKLLDFLESTESLLASGGSKGTPATVIATRASHSRSTFKKLLAAHDSRELKRGIETLKRRVEKHFGDADEAELSRALVVKVLRACEGVYVGVGERVARVIGEVYEGGLEVEWRREDVMAAFRR